MSKTVIELQNIKRNFRVGDETVHALRGVSFSIGEGEFVTIMGTSGSGKSTMLRCINLLEVPTDGEITVDGFKITDKKADLNKIRRNIGMVFQQFNLFPHKTVKENIMLAPVTLKLMTPEEAAKKALELLNRVGLPDKADAYPGSLSGIFLFSGNDNTPITIYDRYLKILLQLFYISILHPEDLPHLLCIHFQIDCCHAHECLNPLSA